MSEKVSVVTVHNTVGEFKPIWICINDQKMKIEKINYVIDNHGVKIYNCIIAGETKVLFFHDADSIWYLDD